MGDPGWSRVAQVPFGRLANVDNDMTCSEFLDQYSEFIDHRLSLPAVARVRQHLRECDGCARYHRVMTRGRGALDELPYVEPSADFYVDLRKRLASERREEGLVPDRRSDGPGVLVALGVAAALVGIVWSPLLESGEPPVIELPAMTAKAPEPAWGLRRGDAVLTPTFTPARSGWTGTRTGSHPSLRFRNVAGYPTASPDLFTPVRFDQPLFRSDGSIALPAVRPASLSTPR